MAMIFQGFSKCPLCGEVLDITKEYLLTPPLISNTRDDLFELSDTGVHLECLNISGLKSKLFKNLDLYHSLKGSEARCVVDEQIVNPRNLFVIGLLTSNEHEDLNIFNYTIINKLNINNWSRRGKFLSLARKFLAEGKWVSANDFNYLEYLISSLI